jgi:hypothetical protein
VALMVREQSLVIAAIEALQLRLPCGSSVSIRITTACL